MRKCLKFKTEIRTVIWMKYKSKLELERRGSERDFQQAQCVELYIQKIKLQLPNEFLVQLFATGLLKAFF